MHFEKNGSFFVFRKEALRKETVNQKYLILFQLSTINSIHPTSIHLTLINNKQVTFVKIFIINNIQHR